MMLGESNGSRQQPASQQKESGIGKMSREDVLKQLKGSVRPVSTAFKLVAEALSQCFPWFIPEKNRSNIDIILAALHDYIRAEGASSMGELPGAQKEQLLTKMASLELPSEWIQPLVDTFGLKELGSSEVVEEVMSRLIRLLRFSEAGAYAAAFGSVTDEASAIALIDGLIGNGDHVVLDKLVRNVPGEIGKWLKRRAVSRLDEYLGRSAKEKDTPPTKNEPPTAALDALLRTWAKEFDLCVEECCPNLSRSQQKTYLNSLIRRTFKSHDSSYSNFEEYARNVLGKHPELTEWFIQELEDLGLFGEAGRWAILLKADIKRFPKVHKELEKTMFSSLPLVPANKNFHTLKLPSSSILWIETERDLLGAMDYILKNVDVIALDSEWDASHSTGYTPGGHHRLPEVAVFQIATKSVVYLLDMLKLRESLQKRGGVAMMSVLVCPYIQKIAYAFRADIELLSIVGPPFNFLLEQNAGLIDFLGIVEDPSRIDVPIAGDPTNRSILKLLFPSGVPTARGLTGLVKGMLGLPLDKRQQASAWRQRPLSCGQVHYAALDAFCLIEIQSILDQRARDAGYFATRIRRQVAEISRKVERARPAEYFAMYGAAMPAPTGPGWD